MSDTHPAAAPAAPAAETADWRAVLDAAIANDPQGKFGVSLRLGVSRPYVSRITTGHIPKASPRFVARVLTRLAQVHCPHLGETISAEECRGYAARDYARIAAHEVPHWRACRACQKHPDRIAAAAVAGPAPAAQQIEPAAAPEEAP